MRQVTRGPLRRSEMPQAADACVRPWLSGHCLWAASMASTLHRLLAAPAGSRPGNP